MVAYIDLCEYPLQVLEMLGPSEPIVIDTETLGATKELNIPIYFSWASRTLGSGAGPTTTVDGMEWLQAICASPNPKIFHNAKFDLGVLERIEVPVNGELHDTILMHCLLDEHHLEHHRLKALSRELLDRARMDEFELRRVQKKKGTNFDTPQERLHPYAVADAEDTESLYYLFKPQLEEQGLWELYRMEVAVEMAYKLLDETGVAIDAQFAQDAIEEMAAALNKLAAQVYEVFGEQFLISSPQQLGNVLSKHFPLSERTLKTGNYKTDKPTLQKFINDPKMQMVFGWKFLADAKSKAAGYLRRAVDGRVHPDYRQTTLTGRCNCHNPNLTTIPKQRGRITEVEVGNAELAALCSEAFRKVRKTFIAPPGALLISFDYSQTEYRSFAHYSGSKRLLDRLNAGEDFHTMVCRMVFGEVTKRLRHIAKVINYGLLYGMGRAYLHVMLRNEGLNPGNILSRYEANLPEMRITQRLMENKARSQGYITDVFGRRYRYVPEWGYKIVSWICQGTSANIKKSSLLRTNEIFERRRTKLVLDIHDDLVFEIYPEDVEQLILVKQAMEDYPQFDVPIKVESTVGRNLLEMEDVEVDASGLKRIRRMFTEIT